MRFLSSFYLKFKMESEVPLMWCVVYPDELYHHGIKGQKWGVRRFQNPDGSLTEVGQRRYGNNKTVEKSITKKDGRKIEKSKKVIKNGELLYEHTTKWETVPKDQKRPSGKAEKNKPKNGKKIAVAIGATVAAAVATGLAIKYRKEIGSVIGRRRTASVDDLIKAAEKASKTGDDVRGFLKNEKVVKTGDAVRGFLQKEKATFISAGEKAIESGMSALFAAPVTVAAGYASKKMYDKASEQRSNKGKQYVIDILNTAGQASLKSVDDSLGGRGGNKKGAKNGAKNGKGIDLESGNNQELYNEILSRFPKDSPERAQVKKKRKEVSTIAELEEYANTL